MYLSVIVPCYNEEKNVVPFYNKTVEVLKEYMPSTELIFVNDGSKDNTFKELKALADKSEYNVKVVNFSRNFGKEAALLAGLNHSTGEYTAIIDADLQQNPKYIIEMLKILEENKDYDGVAAYQEERKEGAVLTFFKSCFYKLINSLTEVEFVKSASDFRVLNRKMVNAIIALPEKCRFSKGIFSWVGFKVYYMPYEVEERFAGTSKWNFWKLTAYAINGIVAFSDKPLIVSSFLGIGFFVMAILMMLWVVIKTILFGDPVAGYPTLASLILLSAGVQLLCIGIVGQYLAKIYTESKGRPVYVEADVIESKNVKKEEV